MHTDTFARLPAQTQATLAQLSAEVGGITPIEVRSWSVATASLPVELAGLPLLEEVNAWADKSKSCLYFLECEGANVDLAAVEDAFARAKAHEANDRAYARLNAQCRCFYVGSSQSVAKRLNDHLGYGARGTYALQLHHWARPLSLVLEFVCAKYADNTPFSVVQALEDTLWQTRQPMFGRQGRK
jgi:hypothetical protein